MMAELEKCQKSLESYLEQKRNKFPRFYFVSDPGLLLILSQGSDPVTMNDHYEKVFDAITSVEHNKKDKTIIERINGEGEEGRGREEIRFLSPVKAVGNIEDWLAELLKKMQMTMKELARVCAKDFLAVTDASQLFDLVNAHKSQFALLGIQMLWTQDMQTAIDSYKDTKGSKVNSMMTVAIRQEKFLKEMSSWCLRELGNSINRRKIETLVTIHVHQRDVADDLKSRKLSGPNDFEWLKQARFSWQPSKEDDHGEGACIISITDVDFKYQHEYLGAKERLVITALTDRAYITLAQALNMFFGGAPAGINSLYVCF
jgi:dynein heavy chain